MLAQGPSLRRSSRRSSPWLWLWPLGNPVKASGLLFAYLAGICQRTTRDRAQVWRLNAANRPSEEPWDFAEHNYRSADDVWAEFKLSTISDHQKIQIIRRVSLYRTMPRGAESLPDRVASSSARGVTGRPNKPSWTSRFRGVTGIPGFPRSRRRPQCAPARRAVRRTAPRQHRGSDHAVPERAAQRAQRRGDPDHASELERTR